MPNILETRFLIQCKMAKCKHQDPIKSSSLLVKQISYKIIIKNTFVKIVLQRQGCKDILTRTKIGFNVKQGITTKTFLRATFITGSCIFHRNYNSIIKFIYLVHFAREGVLMSNMLLIETIEFNTTDFSALTTL